jgi:hypothetical protein
MTSDRHNHSDTKQANCQIKYRLVQKIIVEFCRKPADLLSPRPFKRVGNLFVLNASVGRGILSCLVRPTHRSVAKDQRDADCPVALPPASPHADDPPRYAMIRPKGETKIARNLRPEPSLLQTRLLCRRRSVQYAQPPVARHIEQQFLAFSTSAELGRAGRRMAGAATTRATASWRRQPARRIFSCPQSRPTSEKPRNLFMDP